MSDYKVLSTIDPKTLVRVFTVPGSEWSGPQTPQEFGQTQSQHFVKHILSGRAGKAFYLENKEGEIVSVCCVTQHPAFFRETSVGGFKVPQNSAIGINNITAVRLSFVFTLKPYRGKGLVTRLVKKAIAATEADIIAKESSKEEFLKLATENGKVDPQLAAHHLSKKYVWFLYSGIGAAYAKFGFKGYPVDGYKVPFSVSQGETHELVERLLAKEKVVGKRLHLLDGENASDSGLVEFILQARELELLTELNTMQVHPELRGGRRLLLLLTNISTQLEMHKLGSTNELGLIAEKLSTTTLGERRASGLVPHPMPKFALKPDRAELERRYQGEVVRSRTHGSAENAEFGRIRGAILTNEQQQKSLYVLFSVLKAGDVHIIGMGELQADPFGVLADPTGLTSPLSSRRGSAFSGAYEMGGYNFQDLDILLHTAVYVAKKKLVGAHFVNATLHDLPTTIPGPVLHDFFLKYVPSKANGVEVEHVPDFATEGILPMLRPFGGIKQDIDWVGNGMLTWG